jgi:hypothetical protein
LKEKKNRHDDFRFWFTAFSCSTNPIAVEAGHCIHELIAAHKRVNITRRSEPVSNGSMYGIGISRIKRLPVEQNNNNGHPQVRQID